MQIFRKTAAVSALGAMLLSGAAFAQDRPSDHDRRDQEHSDHDRPNHDDHHGYVQHKEWRKGYRLRNEDWNRGQRIDYAHYHLRRPPSGYEWREVDGNYVMAAVATGLIASVVVASSIH